jgi:hypothetical protein
MSTKSCELKNDTSELRAYLAANLDLKDFRAINQAGLSGVSGMGTTKCILMECESGSGEPLIVKIGKAGTKGGNEIVKNYEAYRLTSSLGVDLVPNPVFLRTLDGYNILVMERGIKSFLELTREVGNPQAAYGRLITALRDSYGKTITQDKNQALKFLNYNAARIPKYLSKYLAPANLVDRETVELSEQVQTQIGAFAPDKVVWSNWAEFLPEHVYASKTGRLFVIDPKGADSLLGIPQVELAMFGTLSKEVYGLPGGEEGWISLRKLSKEVAALQGMSEEAEAVLWVFGEALQYSLSSRFRIGTDDARAKVYAENCTAKIRELAGFLHIRQDERKEGLFQLERKA